MIRRLILGHTLLNLFFITIFINLGYRELNYWTVQSVVPSFQLGVCLSVSLLIIDPWQYCACCIRSGLIRCTLLMVLNLDCMCQCRLHEVLWLHIGILMGHLTAEPRSTAGLLFPSHTPLWNDLAGPIFNYVGLVGFKSRGTVFYWPKLLCLYNSLLLFFPFSSFCL